MKTNLTFDDMLAITKNMAGSPIWKWKKCKWKVRINVSGGIYYYIPNEKNVKDISKKLNEHLGVTPKPVRNE